MHIKRLDWYLNGAILFLCFAGLLSLASTKPGLFWSQLAWIVIGFLLIILVSNFDWRSIVINKQFIWGIYFIALAALVLTYFIAPSIRGVRAWIVLGPFNFQTSELAKLALIIMFSSFFAKEHVGIANVKNIFLSFFYFLAPAMLVIIQPDLGSVLIMFGIWFGYLLVSGIKLRHFLASAIIFLLAFVVLWMGVFQPYQKQRIIGLFVPEKDPLGINYNVIQSKIAIGSAGFFGKGFQQGTQSQLGFLPEAQTDFIFASFTEEWGLFGALLILSAFLIILMRIIKMGLWADNNFSKFICLGTFIMFLLHFILNIGSNLGLTPVIGVPFPFFSYGGSNLLVSSLLIGMIQGTRVYKRF